MSGILSTRPSTATSKAVSAVPSLPAVQVLPARLAPVTDTVAAVAGTPDALVGEAAAAVSTVTETAAPALSHIDNAVAAVDEAVASLEPRLPRLPVPVPVVQLPVPVVQLPVPVVRSAPKPLPGKEARPSVRPAPAASAPDSGRPAAAVHAIPAAKAPAASVAAPSTVRRAATANSPAAPAAAEIQEAGSRGQTLAQLHMTSISRPWAMIAVQTDPLRVPDSLSGVDVVGLAATHGESGSSSSEGSGPQAADVAAFWNKLSQLAGERRLDAAIVLPPSPAFDPGSSPD